MMATYWEIGRRIVESEQQGQRRPEYGKALIKQLAEDLEPRFGWRSLTQMRAFFLLGRPRRFCRHRLQNPSLSLNLAKKFPLTAIGLTPMQLPGAGRRLSG
jgi:hypothetical protein